MVWKCNFNVQYWPSPGLGVTVSFSWRSGKCHGLVGYETSTVSKQYWVASLCVKLRKSGVLNVFRLWGQRCGSVGRKTVWHAHMGSWVPPKYCMSQEWWYTPVISALGRQGQADWKFKAILGYIGNQSLGRPTGKYVSHSKATEWQRQWPDLSSGWGEGAIESTQHKTGSVGSDRKHLSEVRELTRKTDPAFWVPSTEKQFQEALGDLLVTHHDAISQSPKVVFEDKGP